ncbi:hypothetical protein ACRAWD_12010 [Caulobacter segnis]
MRPAAKAVGEVRHCDKAIAMDEKPAQAMRRGKGSSMWNAVEALRENQARACVSAGNTERPDGHLQADPERMGAGLERPAIVANWPNMKGVTTVLDVGLPMSRATPTSWSSSRSWGRPSTTPCMAPSARP